MATTTGIEKKEETPELQMDVDIGHAFERVEGGKTKEIWLCVRVDKDEIIHRNHSRSKGGVEPFVIVGHGPSQRQIPITPRVIKILGSGVVSLQRQHPVEEMRISINLKPEELPLWLKKNGLAPRCDQYGRAVKWVGLAGFSQELTGYDGLFEHEAAQWRRAVKANQPTPFIPHPLWEEAR